jgi:hypothetical protein
VCSKQRNVQAFPCHLHYHVSPPVRPPSHSGSVHALANRDAKPSWSKNRVATVGSSAPIVLIGSAAQLPESWCHFSYQMA